MKRKNLLLGCWGWILRERKIHYRYSFCLVLVGSVRTYLDTFVPRLRFLSITTWGVPLEVPAKSREHTGFTGCGVFTWVCQTKTQTCFPSRATIAQKAKYLIGKNNQGNRFWFDSAAALANNIIWKSRFHVCLVGFDKSLVCRPLRGVRR